MKKKTRRLLGKLLIGFVFAALAAAVILTHGLMIALLSFGGAAVVVGLLVIGISLIED